MNLNIFGYKYFFKYTEKLIIFSWCSFSIIQLKITLSGDVHKRRSPTIRTPTDFNVDDLIVNSFLNSYPSFSALLPTVMYLSAAISVIVVMISITILPIIVIAYTFFKWWFEMNIPRYIHIGNFNEFQSMVDNK